MRARDRRAIPRMPTAIKVESLDGGSWLVAHDVSLGGMFVTTKQPRWPGQMLRLRFQLPGEPRAMRVTCRVIELVEVPHGVGLTLRFLRLHPEAQMQLHHYVDQGQCEPADESVRARVDAWVGRIVEDCAQLRALARP